MDRHTVFAQLDDAARRLDTACEQLSENDLRHASDLPGWSRAHVLTHLARNADGLRGLLLAARSGEAVRMYASPLNRTADIEAGSSRQSEVIVADLVHATHSFTVEAATLDDDSWNATVEFSSGGPNPPKIAADSVLAMRLEELEIHLVDLRSGPTFAETPVPVAQILLDRVARRRTRLGTTISASATDCDWRMDDGGSGESVEAPTSTLLAWLFGRSGHGAEQLPTLRPLA
ncbi:MAG: maleylpyruvate isomerase family mycothiol-dependent enzyme [Actinobacteria bacterium]|nr:maleylpyruvate isomerase family mycothiol-dependent enzyme [Actinomycetota bacterium]